MRPVLICLACGALAACGGGGDAVKLPGPGAFNEMIIDFNNLNRRALDERIPVVVQPTGEATWEGVMVLDTEPGPGTPGQLHYGTTFALIDFDAGTIDGEASGFYYYDEALGGMAVPASGIITYDAAAIQYDADGTPLIMGGALGLQGGPEVAVNTGSSDISGTFVGTERINTGIPTSPEYFIAEGEMVFADGTRLPTRFVDH
ncbi:hypothetical protein EF888_13350 [Silicimonas algicola]|nr:hypothetical protein [Silicimonas algicola]AZQ68031.1 hypothetical protein EF888_13350 [Silicimonas algicola]